MRRRLLWLGLALLAQAAAAEQWVQLTRNEELRLFAARSDNGRSGDIVTVWQLVDYTSAKWVGATVIMSVRNLVEVDCPGRRMRTLAAAGYSEQMGRGRTVVSEKASAPEWASIPPAGSGDSLWQLACNEG